MTITIELPPDEEEALLEKARMSGRDLASYIQGIIQDHIQHGQVGAWPDDLIDREAIAYCTREIGGEKVPSHEEVRQALAKISGSMAEAVIEERNERF
ncbi:hypothetical protein [Paludisphaera rhizosphaerae]|uniref:hypothetical protein n=1 Tax=Paludisphaera rhizosphaerae TaxID=2711216 RepID=UPI0013ECF23E|nr:hypothetical protein [Paludisphaera rhizosphaerae]